jgi:hypothetical protein
LYAAEVIDQCGIITMVRKQSDAHLILWVENALTQGVDSLAASTIFVVENELNMW